MKSLFATRSFWFNLLSGLSLFFLLPELRELVGPNGTKYVLLLVSAINIVLRYLTETPVKPIMQSFSDKTVPSVILAAALTLGLLGAPACAANKAPVLVAQAGLGVAQSIGTISATVKQLNTAAGLPAATALKIQEGLLAINTKLRPLPDILRAIDAAQQAGHNAGGNDVDAALAILQAVSADIATLLGGVPVNETTKALIDLVRAAQTTTTTVLVEVARLRGR